MKFLTTKKVYYSNYLPKKKKHKGVITIKDRCVT